MRAYNSFQTGALQGGRAEGGLVQRAGLAHPGDQDLGHSVAEAAEKADAFQRLRRFSVFIR